MRRRNKLRFLSWQQRRVLLYAFLLLNTIRLALCLLSFGRLKRWLNAGMTVWISRESSVLVTVELIAWAVSVAACYSPGNAKCLAKALTSQLLLNRYGYSHTLHIGVAKSHLQTLEAHAWIECDGRVIVGKLQDLSRFKPLSTVTIER